MAKTSWADALVEAIRRHMARTGSPVFTRKALEAAELDAIVAATEAQGSTPGQTLGRELQELRDAGGIAFVTRGIYRWTGQLDAPPAPSKAVFVIDPHALSNDEPDRVYRFAQHWDRDAARTAGEWILYQDRRRAGGDRYVAMAQCEAVVADSSLKGMHQALIIPGSFLQFGRDVPLLVNGQPVERGLLGADGHLIEDRMIQPVRMISDADFFRIRDLGLVEEEDILPRADGEEADEEFRSVMQEERIPWGEAIERATMAVNRKVRDRQFRKRVLDAYDCTCALTGMKLINGGGRAETQAAHIKSVEAGGPDDVHNGLALSGTVHWMFDRGLISLGDDGEILLSSRINDIESVERLILKDRRARLPKTPEDRPYRRYLKWHREERFYG